MLRWLERLRIARRRWVGDGESVDEAADYVPLVTTLLALAGAPIASVRVVSCSEEDGVRALVLAHGARTWTGELAGDTGWIDEDGLLVCLNRVAAALGARGRYFAVREARWGQEVGVFFGTGSEALALLRGGTEVSGRAQLTRDIAIAGLVYAGGTTVELDGVCVGHGVLVAGQRVDGLPCAEVRFGRSGAQAQLIAVVLAGPHAIGGVTLPAGSELRLDGGAVEWARLAAPLIVADGLALPAGSEIEFDAGRPARCDLGAAVQWNGRRYRKAETIDLP